MQRAILAREFEKPARVLIAANPTFGLDLSAVAAVHRHLREAREKGVAVVVVSEDLDELLEIADRITVMSEGRIVYDAPRAAVDLRDIGRYMAGDRVDATAG